MQLFLHPAAFAASQDENITKPCINCHEIFSLPIKPVNTGICGIGFNPNKYWRRCIICKMEPLCSKNCIQACDECEATYCKNCFPTHFYKPNLETAKCSICLETKQYLKEENVCGCEYKKNTYWAFCLLCPNLVCPPCENTKLNTNNYCNDCFPSKVNINILKEEVGNIIYDRNNYKRKLIEKAGRFEEEEEDRNLQTSKMELEYFWKMFCAYPNTIVKNHIYNINFKDQNNWKETMEHLKAANWTIEYTFKTIYCCETCAFCSPPGHKCLLCFETGEHNCNDCYQQIQMSLCFGQ